MVIAALIKAVPDLSKARYSKSQQQLVESGERLLAPISAHVLEAGRSLKEKNTPAKLVAFLLAREADLPLAKKALAFGADEAVLINVPQVDQLDSFIKASILAAALRQVGALAVVIAGTANGAGGGQVGYQVLEALNLVEAMPAGELERAQPPAFLEISEKDNEPRIPNVMAVMKAASKPVKMIGATELIDRNAVQPAATITREEWIG